MNRSIAWIVLTVALTACARDSPLAPAAPFCTAVSLGSERWPAWSPGVTYADVVANVRHRYVFERQDWRFYHQPEGYQANRAYMFFSGFARLGPETRFDAEGVPMVRNGMEWVYNPVTIAQFALYHHTLHMRGDTLAAAFWKAADKLRAMQGPDGAFRYDYAFDTMQPGWVSAMAQGQALSVFSRAFLLSGDPAYVGAGNASLEFLLTPVAEGGVRGSLEDLDPSLAKYISLYEYDYDLSPHTLNGFIFTLFGLYDWAALAKERRGAGVDGRTAGAVFQCGVQTVARTLQYYDVGGASTYDMRAPLGIGEPSASAYYHKVHIAQLVALQSVAPRPEILQWATAWAASVNQPLP